MNTQIQCDICKGEFCISRKSLREEKITLNKDRDCTEATITFIQCPLCGKTYPVIVDTEKTVTILTRLREIQAKRFKYLNKNRPVPVRLDEKYKTLNQKLDFNRQKVAEKFDGAIYQLDGDTIQLDYRYHAR